MAMQNNVIPSWNFEDNIHYMDCYRLFDHNIRIFFKAIPSMLLLNKDPNPVLQFLYIEILDKQDEDSCLPNLDELNEKVSHYFEYMIISARAEGVARLDWKKLGVK